MARGRMTDLRPADHICICGRPTRRQHTNSLSRLAYGTIKHKSGGREGARGLPLCLPIMGFVWKTETYDSATLPPDNNKTVAPVVFKVSKNRKMLVTQENDLMISSVEVFLRLGWECSHAGC